jgi:VanZ family protein
LNEPASRTPGLAETAAAAADPPPPAPRRSSAWPLAAAWIALIVYASLHPFERWAWPVGAAARASWLPWPIYWSRFDVVANVLAYVPMGALLTLGWLRLRRPAPWSAIAAVAVGAALSLAMEMLQHLLPMRVPSRLDWVLNMAGAAIGAAGAVAAARWGVFAWWQRTRDAWFLPHGTAGFTLLLTWPIGLLFPLPAPLGLGHVLEPLMELLRSALQDTAIESWVPAAERFVMPLSPLAEMTVTALGLLAPCFVAFTMVHAGVRRLLLLAGAALLGFGVTTLSAALNFGPDHALAWRGVTVLPAFAIALVIGLALVRAPARWVAGFGLVAIPVMLAVVNQAATDPYFAQSLAGWEQGRFIRFHGVAQWAAWLWPFGALAFLFVRLAGRSQ